MPAIGDKSTKQDQHRHDYRVSVKNFGPIKEGNIELRPLTVFVGESNTGKSYLATLIYALHRYFSRSSDRSSYMYPWIYGSSKIIDEKVSDPEITEGFKTWLNSAKEKGKLPSFSAQIESIIRSIVEDSGGMAMPLEEEIIRCFGIKNIAELIRYPRAKASEVVVNLHHHNEQSGIEYRLKIRQKNDLKITGNTINFKTFFFDLIRSMENTSMLKRFMLYEASLFEEHDESHSRLLATMLAGETQNALTRSLRRSAYYLPADRTGVMHSHQVVVSTLLQRAAIAGLRPAADVPILSGVLADFLERLIQMASDRGAKRDKRSNLIASHMEENVLRGKVHVDISDANYPHFVYQPKNWKAKLPLMRSSSMVSELAPIVLYLRHIVSPGDILIIEEPESHLHPAMQVEVIRHLAEFVHSGIQVIVTTHSEWVLDELANMVLISQVEEADQTTSDKTKTMLQPHEVGAWLFKPDKTSKGVVIEELKTDDTGLYPSGFDRVAVGQHNRWAEVASRIERSRNETD